MKLITALLIKRVFYPEASTGRGVTGALQDTRVTSEGYILRLKSWEMFHRLLPGFSDYYGKAFTLSYWDIQFMEKTLHN